MSDFDYGVSDLMTNATEPRAWLPPAFDPRGLCPTLARVAFIAWREERTRQGAAWEKQIRGMAKLAGMAGT